MTGRRYEHPAMDFLYGISHYLALTAYDLCFRGEVAGLGNIPRHGAFIIACNHASHLDPPIIGSLVPRQVAFFARKTLWKPGLAQWWLDGVGLATGQVLSDAEGRSIGEVVEATTDGRGALAVATLPAAGPVGGVHGPALASPPLTGLARPA